MGDFINKHKGKIALFVAAGVVAALSFWLGADVDFSALFQGDVSTLGETLENAANAPVTPVIDAQ